MQCPCTSKKASRKDLRAARSARSVSTTAGPHWQWRLQSGPRSFQPRMAHHIGRSKPHEHIHHSSIVTVHINTSVHHSSTNSDSPWRTTWQQTRGTQRRRGRGDVPAHFRLLAASTHGRGTMLATTRSHPLSPTLALLSPHPISPAWSRPLAASPRPSCVSHLFPNACTCSHPRAPAR